MGGLFYRVPSEEMKNAKIAVLMFVTANALGWLAAYGLSRYQGIDFAALF